MTKQTMQFELLNPFCGGMLSGTPINGRTSTTERSSHYLGIFQMIFPRHLKIFLSVFKIVIPSSLWAVDSFPFSILCSIFFDMFKAIRFHPFTTILFSRLFSFVRMDFVGVVFNPITSIFSSARRILCSPAPHVQSNFLSVLFTPLALVFCGCHSSLFYHVHGEIA